jgi:hypothetical protein
MMIFLTNSITTVAIRIVRRTHPRLPWLNTYWRQVAAVFVGPDLTPGKEPKGPSGSIEFVRYIEGVKPELQGKARQIAERFNAFQNLEEVLNSLKTSLEKAALDDREQVKTATQNAQDVLSRYSPTYESEKSALAQLTTELSAPRIDAEWLTLYQALEVTRKLPNRFEALTLNASAFQATGLSAIWVMTRYRDMWSMAGFAFATAVVVLATYFRWLQIKLDSLEGHFQSPQVAAMLAELTKQRNYANPDAPKAFPK